MKLQVRGASGWADNVIASSGMLATCHIGRMIRPNMAVQPPVWMI